MSVTEPEADLINVILTKDGQVRSWRIRHYPITDVWSFQSTAQGALSAGGLMSRAAALDKARMFHAEIDAARRDGWTDRP